MAARIELQGKSVALYLPDLSGGGLERLQLDLAPFFLAAGLDVTLVLVRRSGPLVEEVPPGVKLVSLSAGRQLAALLPLARYLKSATPSILITHTEHSAIIAIWARALVRSKARIIVCQHNTLSAQSRRAKWQFRILPALFRMFLGFADRVVAVSTGVADDLVQLNSVPRSKVTVIYNGVIGQDFERKCAAPVSHPWFGFGVPVIVAAGRMVEQKDFATLITAFATVARNRDVRLVLLGDGPLRTSLSELAKSLDVADRIDMPGFRPNPLPYLRAAAVVVLSSRYEGFGMVLAEALACGTAAVSTACPHGPAEILDHGRIGRLAPPGDPAALAHAIMATLDNPPARELLLERGRAFTTNACADKYLDVFLDLMARRPASHGR